MVTSELEVGVERNGDRATGPTSNSATVNVLEFVQIFRNRWPIAFIAVVASWLIAGSYYVFAPATFESEAKVFVIRKDPRLATQGVGGVSESEAGVSADMLATHMEIVQSHRIVSSALEKEGLDKLPSIVNELDRDETATDYVIDNLLVTRGGEGQARGAHVLNIAFRHSSDVDAQRVLSAVIGRYQDFLGEKFQDVSKEAAELIALARNELGGDLDEAEIKYQTFREGAPVLWNGEESTNAHRLYYLEIQNELAKINLEMSDAQARLETVEAVVEEQNKNGATDLERLALIDEKNAQRVGVLVAVQQGKAETARFQSRQPERLESARSEYQALLAMQLKEQALLADFGPAHSEVANTRRQIELAREFLDKKSETLGIRDEEEDIDPKSLLNAYVKLLRHDVAALQRTKKELETFADKEEAAAKELVKFEQEDTRLRKKVARQQELYNDVVDRLREINLAKDYGGFINEVIAQPELGEQVWPHLSICLALGTLLGLVVGGSGVAITEYRDRRFRSPEELQRALKVPILSTIPSLGSNENGEPAEAIGEDVLLNEMLWTFHHPRSREAEVFRGLRTSLFYRGRSGNEKVIAFTSPLVGDGKSTLIANLAITMAQSNRRVLLIDSDIRRPSIHSLFGLDNERGLTSILTDEQEFSDAVQETALERLQILTSGVIPDDPAELLTSPSLKNLIDMVRERYDHILVDLPPVLSVADPCIVAPCADAIVLVVRLANDRPVEAVRAKAMLTDVGANVIGAIANATDGPSGFLSSAYGPRGYYGYTDSYRQDGDRIASRTRRTTSEEG